MNLQNMLGSIQPDMIQRAFKMMNYVSNNLEKVQRILTTDQELYSKEASELIQEWGDIKYPDKPMEGRMHTAKKEIMDILPNFAAYIPKP